MNFLDYLVFNDVSQQIDISMMIVLVFLGFLMIAFGFILGFLYYKKKESSQYLKDLEEQARLHHPTGLYNANQMYLDVDQLIKEQMPFYFSLGHLNNIKHINDRFGHDIGEKLLETLSQMISQVLPKDYQIYHFGGDEYVIIGIRKAKNHFVDTLDKILALFEQDIVIDQHHMSLSMTFGVADYPKSGVSIDQLINNAHISMRDMLNSNYNRYYFYDSSKYLDRLMIDDFDQYVKKMDLQSIVLELMPVLETNTNHIFAFECLSRLYDDYGDMLPTEKAIQSLERVGRIQELDEIIFQKMLHVKKTFDDLLGEVVVFSVNASAISFNETYVDHVIAMMKDANMKGHVVIELTESYKVEDYEYLLRLFKRLNEYGIQIGIDDFGSGYSSIGYISKFPLYVIKVDKRFVRDYKDSLFNQTLLKTLMSICDVLGSKLVAEGVDSHETLSFLKENGCPYYQGFLFSKAVKVEEAINLYKKHS